MSLSSNPASKIKRTLLFLLFVLLPTQFGKHFWPNFSFITGLRIDYLSPTLYVTDLLIIALLGISFTEFILSRKKYIRPFSFRDLIPVVAIICYLCINALFSPHQDAAMYGVVKIVEFAFLGIYIATHIDLQRDSGLITLSFVVGLVSESLLSLMQFVLQHAVGGVFYLFGERFFSADTPGIANASIAGSLVLRPYGTLPHPNVLGGYLLIAGTIVAWSNWKYKQNIFQKIQLFVVLALAFVTLTVSMSRSALLVACIAGGVVIPPQIKKYRTLIIGIGIILLTLFLVVSPLGYRIRHLSLGEESVIQRQQLAAYARREFMTHPLIGVGANNYLYFLPQLERGVIHTTYIQPVHSLYLLLLSEYGLVGVVIMSCLLWKTVLRVRAMPAEGQKFLVMVLLGEVMLLGLFDHYFLTVQQGQLLLTVVLGFAWSVSSGGPEKKLKTQILASKTPEKYAKRRLKQPAKSM